MTRFLKGTDKNYKPQRIRRTIFEELELEAETEINIFNAANLAKITYEVQYDCMIKEFFKNKVYDANEKFYWMFWRGEVFPLNERLLSNIGFSISVCEEDNGVGYLSDVKFLKKEDFKLLKRSEKRLNTNVYGKSKIAFKKGTIERQIVENALIGHTEYCTFEVLELEELKYLENLGFKIYRERHCTIINWFIMQ